MLPPQLADTAADLTAWAVGVAHLIAFVKARASELVLYASTRRVSFIRKMSRCLYSFFFI